MKLPKQWRHWAKLAGLRPEWGRGRKRNIAMFGRGRRWRVNCLGAFECSCRNAEFDRWANSCGASLPRVPASQAAFLSAVKQLANAADAQDAPPQAQGQQQEISRD